MADLGFGPDDGGVRPTPRGPVPVILSRNTSGNYLTTLGASVASYLALDQQQLSRFHLNLNSALSDLIRFALSENQLIRHIDHRWRLSYFELVMLLSTAAKKQQSDMLDSNDDNEYPPIYCFPEIEQFAMWLEGWICSSNSAPNATSHSARGECSSKAAELPLTPCDIVSRNGSIAGRDLASKKRKLD
ncbi:hypothetical protein Slin15195_G076880 [Septoria linicola]|uniref:Uncharacterized protein n=1 Tax=Septoria linicola TaxID=215465 RepID=A0A9Q9ATE6_9PEZI|nr:hypothetical protein Slin14017_G038030 [Septoria linicola]USW54369.1 hypothetical protein Slin15195_G076880 [Septoria linicola]